MRENAGGKKRRKEPEPTEVEMEFCSLCVNNGHIELDSKGKPYHCGENHICIGFYPKHNNAQKRYT